MTKKQFLFNVIGFIVAVILMPLFLLLSEGCSTSKPIPSITDQIACGSDNCGKEPN
jgi:hypothetical protein